MKLKLKIKNILMISVLAIAGFLGVSSIAINSHADKNSSFSKTEAVPSADKFETKNGIKYRIIYYWVGTPWESVDRKIGSFGFTANTFHYTSDDNGHCYRYTTQDATITDSNSTLNWFGEGDAGDDDYSEIIGDYFAKIYLPEDVKRIRFQSSKNMNSGSWSNQRRTYDVVLDDSTEALVVTTNNWGTVWPQADTPQTATPYTKTDLFNCFYKNLFTVESNWNGGNSKLDDISTYPHYVRVKNDYLTSDNELRRTLIMSSMVHQFEDNNYYAEFYIPSTTEELYLADGFNQTSDDSHTTTKYTIVYDNYLYSVTADSGSPTPASYGLPAQENGYFLYGSFNDWSSSGMIKLTKSGDDYVASGVALDANAELKVAFVQNHIFDQSHDYGFGWGYSPFPLLYPIDNGGEGDDRSHFYIRTAETYEIKVWSLSGTTGNYYCGMSIEPPLLVQYSINGGEKQTMIRTGGGLDQEYQVIYSSASSILPNKGDKIEFYVNGNLMNDTIPEVSSSNSIAGSAGDLYVDTDLLGSETLIFETTSDEYIAYMNGHRNVRTSPYEGLVSGTDFYVRDYSWQDSGVNTWSSAGSITWIRFYDPIGYYDDQNQEVWLNFGSTTGGAAKKCSEKVPQYEGKDVAWLRVELFRCKSTKVTHPDPNGSRGDDNFWNKSENVITVSSSNVNGINITDTNGTWQFNNCSFYLETDTSAGLPAGDSLYIKDEGNWLSDSPALYCYFFNPIGSTGTATSAAATLIPYSQKEKHAAYYELVIPGSDGVRWQAVILFTSPTGDISTQNHKSADILVLSESASKCQYLETGRNYLSDNFTGEDRSDCFAAYFNDIVTDQICSLNWGETSNLEALQAVWDDLSDEYAKMDGRANVYFCSATADPSGTKMQKAASVYDFVVNKYTKTNLPDFATRDGVSITYSQGSYLNPYSLLNNGENSVPTIIIIVASSISLISITALSILLVKKRKKTTISK